MRQGETRCDSCQAKIDCEKYYALPIADWDGVTPTCDDDRDKYFWDKDQLMDEMYWQLEEATKRGEEPEMHVVICEPHYLHQLDGSEWEDDLADEGELSDEVGEALDALNAVLKAQGPSCWYPGKQMSHTLTMHGGGDELDLVLGLIALCLFKVMAGI
jgi:hypothetical protein